MNKEKSDKIEILQNRNLGALNLRYFGVENDQQWRNKENFSEDLKRERAKAEYLLKLSRREFNENKKNEEYSTSDLNFSDYEPYRVPRPISNISDLYVDATINLGNFTNMPTDTKAPKISFEPSEMTGRSTYLHRDKKKQRKSIIGQLSVDDILSGSAAAKIKDLRHSISSTSSINCNGRHSLPRTADMSSNISKNYELSFGASTISKSEGSPKKIKSHESKDSGHASDNSNTMSLSAIDRALAQLDVDDSPTCDVNKFIELAKRPRSHYSRRVSIEAKNHVVKDDFQQSVARILENKENLEPRTNAASNTLSYTLSFTESMLDSFYIGKDELNKNKPHSPLSPLESGVPNYRINVYEITDVDEKEKVYRSTSPFSTSSVFTHRGEKIIPFKFTALSLSWSCTKLHVAAYKSIQVKNTFNKRLVLRAEIHGPGFQIENTSTITLQSQECRTIMISFCPIVTGEAIGEFILCSPHGGSSNNATYVRIPLYAYGGRASIKIIEALRAPDNTFYLPMGNVIELPGPLEQSFKLYNKGPLLGFAIISADSGSFNLQREIDSFTIEPNHVLINPDSSVNIRVTFRPQREYLKKILKKAHSVQVLGYLCVFSGAEVNRQRLRRIARNIPSEERSEKLGLASIPELNGLWDVFPEEIEFSELEALRDDKDSASEFITAFVVNEIALTLNCDELSDTALALSSSHSDIDETSHILYSRENSGAASSEDYLEWSVYPEFINFVMNSECLSFVIVNSYKSRQYFEVSCSCNAKNLLILKPSEGYIDADGGGTMIHVTLVKKKLPVDVLKFGVLIYVYIENERKTIPVTFSNNKH